MVGDIYPTKIYGKTTDTLEKLKFQLPQNLLFLAKTFAASRASDFMVNKLFYTEKYSKVFLWNAWNVLTMMQRRRKRKSMDPVRRGIGTIKSLPVPPPK